MNSTVLSVLTVLAVIAAVVMYVRHEGRKTERERVRHRAEILQRGNAAVQAVAQHREVRPPPAHEPVPVRSASTAPSVSLPARRASAVRWIPEGEAIAVAGYTIPGGMLYVGDPSVTAGMREEPAVIDPALAVDTRQRAYTEWTAGYWPRYAGLSPVDRALYLQWLSTGRSDPNAPIGAVFLFLYGLERRLLEDADEAAQARAEIPRLVAELDRLQRIYDHASFHRHASALRDLAVAQFGVPARFRSAAHLEPGDLPASLAIALGRLVKDGLPLSAGLAFDWARCLDESPRPNAYRLVLPELEALFARRYEARFPAGLTIKPPKRRLAVEHRGAAGNRAIVRLSFDLPDVRSISAPQAPLRQLLQGCVEELQALMRVRKQDAPAPLDLAAALPPDLRGSVVMESLKDLQALLEATLTPTSPAAVDVPRLLAAAGVIVGDRWGKREATALANGLEALGYGIEPDVRFDGPVLDAARPAVLFRLPVDAGKAPTAPYRMGQLLLQLAVAVAAADGSADPRELEEALLHLDRLFALEPSERVRLQAHLLWLEAAPPSLARLTSRLKTLATPARRSLADVVVSIAMVDGRIDAKEMRTLEKVYRALGLDAASLPSDIHHAQTGGVARAPSAGPRQALDGAAIEAKLRETADVQQLLSAIFVNEPQEDGVAGNVGSPAPSIDATPGPAAPAGLDAAHATLLRQLLAHPADAVARETVEQWCEPLGLLPDGALESVNEAAYSLVGDALLDVDDEILLRPDIREQLSAVLQGAPA